MKRTSSMRGNRNGSMPFALIAVTLLLLGSVYGVIYISIENAEDDTKNIERDIIALDDAVIATELDIEARLGMMLGEISRGKGTLAERCVAFDSMTAELGSIQDRAASPLRFWTVSA